jgi:phosphoribosyl-ATP pyrophosphohydrolase
VDTINGEVYLRRLRHSGLLEKIGEKLPLEKANKFAMQLSKMGYNSDGVLVAYAIARGVSSKGEICEAYALIDEARKGIKKPTYVERANIIYEHAKTIFHIYAKLISDGLSLEDIQRYPCKSESLQASFFVRCLESYQLSGSVTDGLNRFISPDFGFVFAKHILIELADWRAKQSDDQMVDDLLAIASHITAPREAKKLLPLFPPLKHLSERQQEKVNAFIKAHKIKNAQTGKSDPNRYSVPDCFQDQKRAIQPSAIQTMLDDKNGAELLIQFAIHANENRISISHFTQIANLLTS